VDIGFIPTTAGTLSGITVTNTASEEISSSDSLTPN
jgi:hypothetical protein